LSKNRKVAPKMIVNIHLSIKTMSALFW
jgi:hypothetical protein